MSKDLRSNPNLGFSGLRNKFSVTYLNKIVNNGSNILGKNSFIYKNGGIFVEINKIQENIAVIFEKKERKFL